MARLNYSSENSYRYFLCALAVFDTSVLFHRFLPKLLENLGISMFVNDFTCGLFSFTLHSSCILSGWLIGCISAERFAVVFFPFVRKSTKFNKRAKFFMIIVIVTGLLSQSYRPFFVGYSQTLKQCLPHKETNNLYLGLHIYVYQLVELVLLPGLCIFICNVAILYKIRSLPSLNLIENHKRFGETRYRKATVMLLFISILYLVTTLPGSLHTLIVFNVTKFMGKEQGKKIYKMETRDLLNVMAGFNYATNFFVYIFSARKFRDELKVFMKCKKKRIIQKKPFVAIYKRVSTSKTDL